ncbi:dynein light chain Tctex-type protein 2B-like [Ruditapes philippinarum]|uniref:dynein light chain Tctex-type protein 2B-like n=2 Tax=Ruditapes philippinarum TaxID=129788 RepID=UPI00295BEF4E|nr:dynein light chain Tctex-type protein 2B-like [Ruditapes philippinarum]
MADVEVAEQPPPASNTYVIRPNFQHKFRPVSVKECIHAVLNEHLDGKTYDPEEIMDWTKTISDDIKTKLKDMGYDRYKFVVQVAIGEQRGEGVKMGARCFWDSDTDNYAQDIYMNDSLFCVAAAFGVFYY